MENRRKLLPVGIECFQDMIRGGVLGIPYYYVDKSEILHSLLACGQTVHLIPRPRCFGTSLMLSMLEEFLSVDGDPTLFDGLRISEYTETCRLHQGKYPVLRLTLEDITGNTFASACRKMGMILSQLAWEIKCLKTSEVLDSHDRELYSRILALKTLPTGPGMWDLYRDRLEHALTDLIALLHRHYGRKPVLLIDSYDTPLSHACTCGYCDDMVSLIRGMFHAALADNGHLAFAVLTGCLCLPRESIFPGVDNLTVWSSSRLFPRDFFGFTETEVREILDYYGLPELLDTILDWYNGFSFGREPVCCPWEVMSYVNRCLLGGPRYPENYWVDSRSNGILNQLLSRADARIEKDYVTLMAGQPVRMEIREELTWADPDTDPCVIWSRMVATGYLTIRSRTGTSCELSATNREIRYLLSTFLSDWIAGPTLHSTDTIGHLCEAIPAGDCRTIQKNMNDILDAILHLHSPAEDEQHRETFHPGILLGVLFEHWMAHAEVEFGDGYLDVRFESDPGTYVFMELRRATDRSLAETCRMALDRIRENRCADALLRDGAQSALCYGIGFQKTCMVQLERRP